jgi:hypothetical protein
MSAAVNTAATPGAALAADVSIFLMRACPCGLRRMAACAMPGNTKSAV